MLKHAAPLVGPVLGVASEHLANQLSYETRLMTELVSKLPVPEGFGADLPQLNDPRHIELHVDYRALYALLRELDPSDHWAGLSRIHTPEGEVLWLCSDHSQQYSP
jgi:internalin A